MCASALTAAVFALGLAAPARATLGADLASVQADQLAWEAGSSQTALTGATRHNQTLSNGVTVRQYVDASGCVFAVAWDGPVLPDFVRLLGTRFAVYAQAVRQQKHGVSLRGADLVIESGGMMRSFSGRAYLPNKLPAGLREQDVR